MVYMSMLMRCTTECLLLGSFFVIDVIDVIDVSFLCSPQCDYARHASERCEIVDLLLFLSAGSTAASTHFI